ncbi:hypothetical protein CH339_11660 [Rhodobium orientis]|uniref:MalT-like TPR region domain-containing protein n=1 Tax=Rhodobium orientis TaxID=34017 RepID=A0A327JL33_9HYPH|nr:hypothetical protein CH339_11660 [Rhodobium orientis]
MLKELELTPLFVEQFILLLEQRGAISHDNIGYYVSDYKLVKREVASLVTGNNTRRLDVLLSRRFEAFEHTLSSKQWLIVDLLSKLLLIPSMAFDALGIELPDVSRLIELGLVVEDAGRAIEFRHQTLLRLMRAKRPASKEVDSDLEVFFRDSRWQMLYLPQFTLQEIRFNRLAKSQISTLFDHLDQGRVDASDLLPLIEPLVRLELDRLLSWFSAGYVIRIFDHTAYRLRPVLGYERAAELYQLIHSELHVRTKQLRDAGSEYVMLCVRFGSLLLGMRQDQKAMRVLKAAFSSVEDLQFLTENSKQEAIGLIANRLCAALLGHRRSLEARKVGLVAMKAARAGKCQYIEFQQHIDNGYIHYGFAAETPQLLAEWQNALSMFDEMFLPAHELITNRAVAKLHHSHILILEGKREEALELIRREILNCQISLDPFHEAKLSILGAIIFMLEGEDLLAAEEALEFVAHAKDISSRFDLGQVYWVAFHAGAKIWQILEEKEKAIGELSRAFEELVSVVENAEIEDRFDWFFEDYAVTLRLFQAQSLARDKSLIRRNKRREAVSTILAMADIEFSLFHSQYVPQSTYSRERLNFPCP